ncbi:MAG: hypothetical protein AAF614_41490, partial [Chloroflexota bacterium]
MIKGDFDDALAELDTAEVEFAATDDPLGRWRWLLTKISYLRRRSGFPAARRLLNEAYKLAQHHPAPAYKAQTHFQHAYITWLHHGNFQEAETEFKTAVQLYEAVNQPLWLAQSFNGLAQIYTNSGRLTETGKILEKARLIYEDADVPSLLADNLLDSGRFEMYRGELSVCLQHWHRAKELHQQLGNKWPSSIISLYEGEVYLLQKDYQKALFLFENAHQQIKNLKLEHRRTICEIRLVLVWLELGNIQ